MAGSLGLLQVYIGANTTRFNKALTSSEKRMRGFTGRMRGMGKAAGVAAATGLAIFAKSGIQSSIEFEDAMVKSTSIVREMTNEQRQLLEKQAKTLSQTMPKTATEIAKSYEYLFLAGMDVNQALKAMPIAGKFAVANSMDMKIATDLATDAQIAFYGATEDSATSIKQLSRLTNVLSYASTQSNATTQQLAEALVNDGAAGANQMGLELETTVAILDAYAAKGKKGAEAGTLLGRGLRLLGGAYTNNSKIFKKYGIDVIDKQTGQFRNIIDIIGNIDKAFGKLTKPEQMKRLKELGFETLSQKAIQPLLGMTKAMKGWEKQQRKTSDYTEKVYNKRLQSVAQQWKTTGNNIENASMSLTKHFLPAAKATGKAIGWIAKQLDKLEPMFGGATEKQKSMVEEARKLSRISMIKKLYQKTPERGTALIKQLGLDDEDKQTPQKKVEILKAGRKELSSQYLSEINWGIMKSAVNPTNLWDMAGNIISGDKLGFMDNLTGGKTKQYGSEINDINKVIAAQLKSINKKTTPTGMAIIP